MKNHAQACAVMGCFVGALVGGLFDANPQPLQESNQRLASPVSPMIERPYWPPKPKDIVSVEGSILLSAGESAVIYTVPPQKYFVVTALQAGTGQVLALEKDLNGIRSVVISINYLSAGTNSGLFAGRLPGVSIAPLGHAFEPGSQVVLTYRGTSGTQNTSHFLGGYLVRANAQSVGWPPHPRDMVSFDLASAGLAGQNGLADVPARQIVTAMRVPLGRTLIMTSSWKGGANALPVFESIGGVMTKKGVGLGTGAETIAVPTATFGPLGTVFQGGSDIVLSNVNSSSTQFNVGFGFCGYYVDE